MIKIILFITLFISLQSCVFSNCEEMNLTAEDKQWLNPYLNADTILFKSDKNRMDTLISSYEDGIYEDYSPCNKFELGPNTYNYSGIAFKSKNCHGSKYCFISIRITKEDQEKFQKECIKRISIFDLKTDFINTSDSLLKFEMIKLHTNKMKVKTLFFKNGDTFSNYSATQIKSFNWSKKFGLVRYKTSSGETFDLYRI